jgi:hypothetical protein
MNLLLNILLYLAVGCGEWYLAVRRTLACSRGEKGVLVLIVFIENLLGLWVLSNFIRSNNWLLALSYAAGASLGAFLVADRDGRRNGNGKRCAAVNPGGSARGVPDTPNDVFSLHPSGHEA